MPVHRVARLPDEVTRNIDGEGELDPLIQRQAEDARAGRERRELPREFIEKIYTAHEYAMAYQRLDDCERLRRRGRIDEWLDTLREGNRFQEWCDRTLAPARPLTAKEKKDRRVADERAKRLLRSTLSPQQLKEFDRKGYFHVVVKERRFRITGQWSHGIKEVDAKGRILRTLCAHPVERVPIADMMLTQKLWLEASPKEFIKIANVIRQRRGLPLQRRVPQAELDRTNREARENIRIRLEQAALDATALTQGDVNGNDNREAEPPVREVPRPQADAGQARVGILRGRPDQREGPVRGHGRGGRHEAHLGQEQA
jgi:hypothetical protein